MDKRLALLLLAIAVFSQNASAIPAQVLLIRHGEKPPEGDDLSEQGWQRAKALPALFDRPEFKAHGTPVALFAQTPQSNGGQSRPFETLKYVAESLKQGIHTEFQRDDFRGIVREIRQNPAYDGKFVVICWEHKVLEDIAAEFGVNPKPVYPKDRFDRAWLITYSAPDAAPRFDDLAEHLLPGDDDK